MRDTDIDIKFGMILDETKDITHVIDDLDKDGISCSAGHAQRTMNRFLTETT